MQTLHKANSRLVSTPTWQEIMQEGFHPAKTASTVAIVFAIIAMLLFTIISIRCCCPRCWHFMCTRMYRSVSFSRTGTTLDSENPPQIQLKDVIPGETIEQRDNHRTHRYWFREPEVDYLDEIEAYALDEHRSQTLPRKQGTLQRASDASPIIKTRSHRDISQGPQNTYIGIQAPTYTQAATPIYTMSGTTPATPMSILKKTQPNVVFSESQLV
jgi:hypothetical protein